MIGSNTKHKDVLKATAHPPQGGDYVWDGKSDEDRPLSTIEMLNGIKNKGGRPKLANPKQSITVRYDADIIAYFKESGKGWQTKMNNALSEWIKDHAKA